jgi:hypothetical protein
MSNHVVKFVLELYGVLEVHSSIRSKLSCVRH